MDLFNLDSAFSLLTLLGLELVLGIDNLIFIVVAVYNLEHEERERARNIGLMLALIFRVLILITTVFFRNLKTPLVTIGGFSLSFCNIFQLLGGGFLLIKAISELYELSKRNGSVRTMQVRSGFYPVIFQIIVIDMILSFDSIMAAVSVSEHASIIVISIMITVILMMFLSRKLGKMIYKHQSIKVLALSIVSLLGISLIINGFNIQISKSSLYLAIFFAITFEIIRTIVIDFNKDSQHPQNG
ncbi:MAG: TerC family protein [Alphaproteobacteria bacterium]|nr:TerC family protein [Alphaproteobacteria bacterium]OJV12174.1 MAG: hypothetical protein BGO27_05490 [Alphaproteobacteria bacterium 33-17]